MYSTISQHPTGPHGMSQVLQASFWGGGIAWPSWILLTGKESSIIEGNERCRPD
jgi:hypothetical protein